MHDLVIRGATVVDGSGAPPRVADIAVDGEVITAVEPRSGRGRRELDADGRCVLPGWVDVHSHFDGQATWDPYLTPSSWHGVTTSVFGNCGVGFAPVRRGSEPFLINLMEGVEDIPGTVLSEGIDFSWETFPEYLDALASHPRAIDIGAQIPHGALRFYVMGDRGADHAEAPTADEIAEMGRLVREALAAGALGFTTSRTVKHRARDGRPTPSLSAGDPELNGIAEAMAVAGMGVIEANSDFGPGEFAVLRRMAELSGRPLSVLLLQVDNAPDLWRETLSQIKDARAHGVQVTGQVGCRPIGVMMGLGATVQPFRTHPAFASIARRSFAEQVHAMRTDATLRERLVRERPNDPFTEWMERAITKTFVLGDPPNYEPRAEDSVAARAARAGIDRWAFLLDLLLEDDGQALLLYTFENYANGSLEDVRTMLVDDATICGLGDAGAHVATICDASYPTFLLSYWGRDRADGRIPIERLVRKHTFDTATAYGLQDRGLLVPGRRADLNVVELERLGVGVPRIVHDLPAGGRRLVQHATGYAHTFVAGTEIAAGGEPTGALPGRLIRGAQAAVASSGGTPAHVAAQRS